MVISMLRENASVLVKVSGHTDSNGDENYNNLLSRKRSEEVKKYLTEAGVRSDRIQLAFYGEMKPLTSNSTKAGRKFNRRTEIEFVSQ